MLFTSRALIHIVCIYLERCRRRMPTRDLLLNAESGHLMSLAMNPQSGTPNLPAKSFPC